jgi:hypothetical protein
MTLALLLMSLALPSASSTRPSPPDSVLLWEREGADGSEAIPFAALAQHISSDDVARHSRLFIDCAGALAIVEMNNSIKNGNLIERTSFVDVASGFAIEATETIDYPGNVLSFDEIDFEFLRTNAAFARAFGTVVSELGQAEYSGEGSRAAEVAEARVAAMANALVGGSVPTSFVETARCVQQLCEETTAVQLAAQCTVVERLPLDAFPGANPGERSRLQVPAPTILSGEASAEFSEAILKRFPESYR